MKKPFCNMWKNNECIFRGNCPNKLPHSGCLWQYNQSVQREKEKEKDNGTDRGNC